MTPEDDAGWLRGPMDKAPSTLLAGGDWTVRQAAHLQGVIGAVRETGQAVTRIDLSQVTRMDTTGAMLLRQLAVMMGAQGHAVALEAAAPRFQPLLELADKAGSVADSGSMGSRETHFSDVLYNVGWATVESLREGRDLLNFLGLVTVTFWRSMFAPSRWRVKSFITQLEHTGFNALLIVGLLQFLIGVVLAYLMADQFRRFGAEVFTVNLIGLTMLQEAGVLITAILLAGRSGSAFTAQIGTMRVNEEIDAMQVLGVDVVEALVLPRVLALLVTLPLLTFFADVCGILGGAAASMIALDLSLGQFMRQLHDAVTVKDFLIGAVKAPVHAVIIALVGCYEGLKVERSAESVGRLTTKSVVESIVLVILATAVFAVLFSVMGIR